MNAATAVADGSVTTAKLSDNAVTATKLSADVRAQLDASASGSVNDGAITTAKLADGSVTTGKIADGAITTAKLADGSVTTGKLPNNVVTNDKIASGVAIAKISGLQQALDAKADAGSAISLGDLSNVTVSGATDGQSLVYRAASSSWGPASVSGGAGGETDHGALVGLGDDDHPQYLNNARGDARYYTRAQTDAAVNGRAAATTQVATGGSLTGGGDLTANRTLSLAGDVAAPGNSKYYGTNGTGAKGFYDLPADGGTEVADGAVTTAKIADGAVTAAKLADNAVSTVKIAGLAVTDAKLAENAVVTAKVADNAVTEAKLSAEVRTKLNATGGGSTDSAKRVTMVPRTSDYTMNDYEFVLGNASAGLFTVTFPPVANGASVSVKKVDSSSNAIIVRAQGSVLIDDQTTISMNNQWASQDFISDGVKWYRI